MEQLNYPIKYAILGIEEQVGWMPGLHEMEREYDVCGYIVSKVYVVGENIKYYGDGSFKKSYQVVFPFTSINEKNNILRTKSYSLFYSDEKLSWKERVLKGRKVFDSRLIRYLEFEDLILKDTSDMVITSDNRVIVRIKNIKH